MWHPVTSTNKPLLVQDSTLSSAGISLAFQKLLQIWSFALRGQKGPPPPRCVTTTDWDPLWHSSQTNFQSINTGQTPQRSEETLFPSLHRQWMLVGHDSITCVNKTFSRMTYHKSYWQLTDNEINPLYFSIGHQPNLQGGVTILTAPIRINDNFMTEWHSSTEAKSSLTQLIE